MEPHQFQATANHLQLWAVQVKVTKVVLQIQWIHVEAILINSKMVLLLDIILQATVKEVLQAWATWEDTANHLKASIHLHTEELAVTPHQETSLLQRTSIKTQWVLMVNQQACQTLLL